MADKYTKEDVIIWPDDPRLKGALDKACYTGESPAEALYVANKAIGQCLLIDINAKSFRPFKTSFEGIIGYYPVIILKKDQPQKSYEERQAEWVKKNDLSLGDTVRILRKANDYEDGWENTWKNSSDKVIGQVVYVDDIMGKYGIRSGGCSFPYFVLEKVTLKYVSFDFSKEEDRDIVRDKWLIKLYCGNFAKEECRIIGFSENAAILSVTYDDGYGHEDRCITGTELLEKFTFLDGAPCGKKVIEKYKRDDSKKQ